MNWPSVGPSPTRSRAAALALTLALLAAPTIGRAVVSSDGAEVLAETLGLFVTGRLEAPTAPPEYIDPFFPPATPLHSRYGFFPSLLLVPFVAAVWPFREALGPVGVDAGIALAWPVGTLLLCAAFVRLARAIEPEASPFWSAAILAATPLWPYAADSFFEPWAGAGLALSAAILLAPREDEKAGRAWLAAVAFGAGCWLKPVVWVTAPAFVLAAALARRRRADASRFVVVFIVGLMTALAGALAVNLVRNGRIGDFGYGYGEMPFVTPLSVGLVGLTVSPTRGLLLFAPIVLVALLAGARRASAAVRTLCIGAPLTLSIVAGQWYGWHGGSAWGPRYLIPVLALAVAPAVLARNRVIAPAIAVGVLVNLPGVLVAPGAWLSYVERLEPPPGAAWPKGGGERISEKASLSQLYGHAWLLARSAGLGLPAPWLGSGTVEGARPPRATEYLSPLVLRRLAGLPPIRPVVPNILYRTAVASLRRGFSREATLFAREAVRIDPNHRPAADLLGQLARVPAR
jgi:hypothetical protein